MILKKQILSFFLIFFYQNKKILAPNNDEIDYWYAPSYKERDYQSEVPKIIWSFWDSEELPETIKICFKSWQKLHPDYEINILNNETIQDFLPDFPIFEKDFNPVFKCDLLRLRLLKKFGGIYLDAAVFLNQTLERYFSLFNDKKLDLLVFSSEGHPNDKAYPITESWFIMSNKNNLFLEKWIFHIEGCFFSNNFASYFRDNIDRKIGYESVNEVKRDYFYIYMASQLVMREISDIKIGFLNSKKNGFFYNYYFKFNYEKIAKFLLLQTKYPNFPSIVKLIAKNRIPIEKMIKNKCYRKNSLFGKYINN